MSNPIQPNIQNCCSNCLEELVMPEARLKCGGCKKRIYCSKSCQKSDWVKGHNFWCCKAGEIGYDYEIKPSEKFGGFGVFALRDFVKSEKIMAKRGITVDDFSSLTVGQKNFIQSLEPKESNLFAEKFDINALDCGFGTNPVICFHASRINHQCPFVENCSHNWIKEHKIKIIYAKRDIKAGEELTISYIDSFDKYDELKNKWGFNCVCDGCNEQNKSYNQQIIKLNNFVLNSKISSDIRIKACEKLLDLYSSKNIPVMMYQRTFYDAYNLLWNSEQFIESKIYLNKCIDLEFEIFGFETLNLNMLRQRLALFG